MRTLACDIVLIENEKILLIKRGHAPFKGMWALPGGKIENNESAEDCAKRELKEETGLNIKILNLVGIYSDPSRDPRKIISAVYLAKKIKGHLKAGDDAADICWFELSALPHLAFDHQKIIKDSIKQLSSK